MLHSFVSVLYMFQYNIHYTTLSIRVHDYSFSWKERLDLKCVNNLNFLNNRSFKCYLFSGACCATVGRRRGRVVQNIINTIWDQTIHYGLYRGIRQHKNWWNSQKINFIDYIIYVAIFWCVWVYLGIINILEHF